MFTLIQIVKFFLISPISWIGISLIAGICLQSCRWRKALFIFAGVLFIFFTNPLILDSINYQRLKDFPQTDMKSGKTYKVAIVMGGFSSIDPATGSLSFIDNRGARLIDAIVLYREGKVKRLLITGDPSIQTHPDGTDTSSAFLTTMNHLGIPADSIILDKHALNTRENAINSTTLLKQLGIPLSDCIVITNAEHIHRSLDCFAAQGGRPAYYAIGLPAAHDSVTIRSFIPSWNTALNWQILLNESIGALAYSLT